MRLIDGDALKEKRTCLWDSALGHCACVLIEDIDDAPTINPEDFIPHGRWRKRKNERACSNCKFIYYSNNDDFNYCPNCGAKMNGKEQDNG